MNLKDILREKAYDMGSDMFGVASIDRFAESPEGRHPTDILPGCKSVIVIGTRLLDGIVQVNFRAFEDGRRDLKGLYNNYGYALLPNFQLTAACYAIAQLIERRTDEVATPCSTGPMTSGVQLSIRHAAVAAGLGQFGWNDLVLTPKFGPRNRFGVILTTAELEADPMLEGQLCHPENCGICVKACPGNAIAPYGTEPETGTIGDKTYSYNKLNKPWCNMVTQGLRKEFGGREDLIDTNTPTPEQVLEAFPRLPISEAGLQHRPQHHCGACLTYCPVGKWAEKFKKRGLTGGVNNMK